MSELRQDRTTGQWVIVAPERQLRPQDWNAARAPAAAGDAGRADCPFCPGHEARLPTVVAEIRQAAPPGWMVRAVPNRYPALQMAAGQPLTNPGNHRRQDGRGCHEVIIESPRHDIGLDSLSDTEREAVFGMYQQRMIAIAGMPGIEWVVAFRNHGERAGSSLRHPHAQLIGLPLTSELYRGVEAWSRSAYEKAGRCVLCQELEDERRDGIRLVAQNDGFVALAPFAATGPFEIWIVPKHHAASFAAVEAAALAPLASLTGHVLRRLKSAIGDVPYNVVVDSACNASRDALYLHWKLRIVPVVTMPGGFELGTAVRINPSSPEADAKALRQAAI